MKYYCILSSDGFGGVWTVVKESLLCLKNIYDVKIIIFAHKQVISCDVISFFLLNDISYDVIYVNSFNGWLADIEKILKLRQLKNCISSNENVIIHSHDSFLSGVYLYFLKKKNRILFTTFHGALIIDDTLKSKLQLMFNKYIRFNFLIKSKSHLISCDPLSISIIKQLFSHPVHIDLAINGVASKYIDFIEDENRTFTVAYMSRFHPLKGWNILAEACKKLNENGIKVNVLFAGNGECEEDVKQWCSLNSSFSTFLGHVDDVSKKLFPFIDLHVLPTKYPEGLPMIILETMSVGIPTITTRVGSNGYAVKNMYNGLLIEPKVDDLFLAIKLLINDRKLYRTMKSNCLYKWKEEFSSDAMVKRYVNIFNKYIYE